MTVKPKAKTPSVSSSVAGRHRILIDEGAMDLKAFQSALSAVEKSGGPNLYFFIVRRSRSLGRVRQVCARTPGAAILTRLPASAEVAPTITFHGGTADQDMLNYGLALTDAVAAPPAASNETVSRAKRLGKALLKPADVTRPVSDLDQAFAAPASLAAAAEMDTLRQLVPAMPDAGQNHHWVWVALGYLRRWFGQIDVILVDFLASVGVLVGVPGQLLRPGRRQKLNQIISNAGKAFVDYAWLSIRSVVPPGPFPAYFGPTDWKVLCPAPSALTSDLEVEFDWLDRAAVSGARTFRSLVWLTYSAAWLAVVAAVRGHLAHDPAISWLPGHISAYALVELVLLSTVAFCVWWLSKLQYRWTACRVGAEQIRVAQMALSVHIAPSFLLSKDRDSADDTPDNQSDGEAHNKHSERHKQAAAVLAYVKRLMRTHPPVYMAGDRSVFDAAAFIRCIVSDQRRYHERNHARLAAVEDALRAINLALFVLVGIVVIKHLAHPFLHLPDWGQALFYTACLPALAATLHGASARLEIARRSDLSEDYRTELHRVEQALDTLLAASAPRMSDLQRLTRRAMEAMGSEADAWHANMLLEPVALP